MIQGYAQKSQLRNLLPTAARTATANGAGVDCSGLTGAAAVIYDSSAGTGTAPTQDVKLQSSPDNATWTDVPGAAFAQVTGAASQQKLSINLSEVGRYIRAVVTIGGTTPSFTASLNLIAIKQSE